MHLCNIKRLRWNGTVLVVSPFAQWVGPQELEARANVCLVRSSTCLVLKQKGENWGKVMEDGNILRNF